MAEFKYLGVEGLNALIAKIKEADASKVSNNDFDELAGKVTTAEGSIAELKATVNGSEGTEGLVSIVEKIGKEVFGENKEEGDETTPSLKEQVEANTSAIADITKENGTIDTKVKSAVDKLVGTSETLDNEIDTIKEIVGILNEDESATGVAILKHIGDNTTAINSLKTFVGNRADGETAATGIFSDIAELDKDVAALKENTYVGFTEGDVDTLWGKEVEVDG